MKPRLGTLPSLVLKYTSSLGHIIYLEKVGDRRWALLEKTKEKRHDGNVKDQSINQRIRASLLPLEE